MRGEKWKHARGKCRHIDAPYLARETFCHSFVSTGDDSMLKRSKIGACWNTFLSLSLSINCPFLLSVLLLLYSLFILPSCAYLLPVMTFVRTVSISGRLTFLTPQFRGAGRCSWKEREKGVQQACGTWCVCVFWTEGHTWRFGLATMVWYGGTPIFKMTTS